MPDLINEKLANINQLFIEGLYLKAFDSIVDFEQNKDLTPENQLSCSLLKSNLFYELGKYADALKFAEQACNMSQELGSKTFLVDSYISKAWSLLELRDFDLVLQSITRGEELLNDLIIKPRSDFAKRDALLKLIKSLFCLYKSGNIDKALEYGEQGLKISEEHDNKKEIALALQLTGGYYIVAGNLDRALDYKERCLRIQNTYRKRDDWITFKELGVLNGIRGELDLALDYTKQSLALAEEIGNKPYIAQCLNNISLIHRQNGNLDHASEALERNLTICQEAGDKMGIMMCLDSLFIISLDANSLKQAQQYLLRMQQINEQVKDKRSDVACRVNKALMLKMSSNSLDQEKAKEILQEFVKEEIINWEFTERALLHLCDLLLSDLQTYNNQDVLSEINPLINQLLDFAEFQRSYRLLADTHLLQGKLALIKLNMGDARQLLTKAERIADEHGLHLLARTISNEHDKVLQQLDKLIKASVSERLKLLEIDKTLDHMMGKQMMKPPVLVEAEQPILLTIMTEHGDLLLSNQFTADLIIDHILLTDYMSSFSAISNQIFSESIDRVKFGKYKVLMKSAGHLLICYMFQGQTYNAQQKLTHFTEIINQDINIKKSLENAISQKETININDNPVFEEIIINCFMSDPQIFRVPFKAYVGDDPFVFVSYTHRDKLEVYPVIDYLNKMGMKIWYDEGIPVSENWKKSIAHSLERCDTFLVFISPHIIDSEYVRKEISFALKKKKKFVAVYLKETKLPLELEFEIADIQALMKYIIPKTEFYTKIREVLQSLLVE